MENEANSKYTIHFTQKALTYLAKHTDLDNPEQVKTYIAHVKASNGYRRNLSIAYNKYTEYYGIQWKMTTYKPEPKPIRIPTKGKLEMLIASAHKPTSTKLKLSMETGLRPIELCNLKVKDIDLEQRLIYPTTAKNGNPKRLRISQQLTDILTEHVNSHKLQPTDKLFKGNPAEYGTHYRALRNKLADKLARAKVSESARALT